MEYILRAKNIVKDYGNGKKALNGFNLDIESGKIVGLLGNNGSGKTTFMKMAAGILRKTSGEIEICGHEPDIYTKSIVSYLPDANYLYEWMKVKDAVKFFEEFYKDFDAKKARELLGIMELDGQQKISSLSKGMVEKLNLTLVLSRNAKLYMLDEPLGAVDPVARDKILNVIIDNFSNDSSMLVTTHLVSDIERLFDSIAFIKEGKIVLFDDAENLRSKYGESINELYKEVLQNV